MGNDTRKCSIDGCDNGVRARGWCSGHYSKWQRNGDPELTHPSRLRKRCTVDGCSDMVHARGVCHKHYLRLKRTGSTEIDNPWFATPDEAFAHRTERAGECLIWTGALDRHGYGEIKTGKKIVLAHRWAWERSNGSIPDGMVIDHKEHCLPVCVEVKHLRLATADQNKSHRAGANRSNKSTGIRNVTKIKTGFAVSIRKQGKTTHVGVYKTIEEASVEAEKARRKLFGEYAGRGIGSRGVKASGGGE